MVMRESLLDRLNRKYGRYAIGNLMLYIVIGMAAVYLFDMLIYPLTGVSATRWLSFNRAAILRGQVWRLLTFIFIPQSSNLLFLFLSLYFYWMIGTGLQQQWGSFRFNIFYLCGMLGSILAGFLTGYATNTYLNMSLFLAFALIYPDFQVLLIFLPVKVKWLALIDVVMLLPILLQGTWRDWVVLAMSLINLALFFWHDGYLTIKNAYRRYQWKKNWRS